MMAIRINNYVTTKIHGEQQFRVTRTKTGYKKNCFETDIGEMYFMDNRFESWVKVKKNEKFSKAKETKEEKEC